MKTLKDLIDKINKKIYSPVYFLWGDEPYYIDKITDFVEENVLSESEKDFNFTTFYGKDSSVEEIINVCRRFPMMSNYQVVIVKEAQQLKQIEKLQIYFKDFQKSTLLVINYKGKVDKRKKFYKDLQNDQFIIYESAEVKGEKVNQWIESYLKGKNFSITPKATIMLVEFLGNNLSNLANELDKLVILLSGTNTITEDHIEENIGISKDFNIFELQNAIGDKNHYKAYFIAKYFSKNTKEHPFVMSVTMLFRYFSKLLVYHSFKNKSNRNELAAAMDISPYFIQDYSSAAKNYTSTALVKNISILREYDMMSKGVDSIESDQGELLKEMIYRLMN